MSALILAGLGARQTSLPAWNWTLVSADQHDSARRAASFVHPPLAALPAGARAAVFAFQEGVAPMAAVLQQVPIVRLQNLTDQESKVTAAARRGK